MIDTHAHLMMLKSPLDEVLHSASEAGVKAIINVAVDYDSACASWELAKQHKTIFATVGIHPLYQEKFEQLNTLIELATAYPERFVAIGEAGLDYKYGIKSKDQQFSVLEAQFKLARALNKPIILHNRFADDDIAFFMNKYPDVKAVVHCFCTGQGFIDAITHRNFFISFNGLITTRLTDETKQVVESFPLERMMLETECPYLTPKGYGRKENQPAYMDEVVAVIAELKQLSNATAMKQTQQNSCDFFSLHV